MMFANVPGLGEGGDFYLKFSCGVQIFFHHKCVCGALNRHFCHHEVAAKLNPGWQLWAFFKYVLLSFATVCQEKFSQLADILFCCIVVKDSGNS